jgi:hypothetical protein
MANPTAPTEGGGLAVDFLTDAAGAPRFKVSAASNAITGATAPGGYQGVATHPQLAGSFGFGSPVVAIAGADGATVRAIHADANGYLSVAVKNGPTVWKTLSAVDISSEATIWTPASGKKFRLMGYVITQGTLTGNVTLKDDTAGTTILVIPAHTVGIAQVSPPMGEGILSSTADHVLTATGASTETISGYVFGTEE